MNIADFTNGVAINDPLSMRQKIVNLKDAILDSPDSHIEGEVRNIFTPGIYARELTIPAGSVIVGKVHKQINMNIITKGEISVLTEDGIKIVKAGEVIISQAGIQRVGYAHEETVWITLHGTNETDLDKIEDEFIAQSYESYLEFCETKKIKGD